MNNQDHAHPFDRRVFLAGAGALALMGAANRRAGAAGRQGRASDKRLRQMLAEFVVGFDLKQVPPAVIDRARVAFIDTIGVAVAGSHEEVAHIVAEMVKAEGSAPQCTIIGQSLRASPQLAALANGVANHAMDYDFTFLNGQSVAPVIPALLPVAEATARRRPTCSAPSSSAARSRRASSGRARGWAMTAAGTSPASSASSRPRRPAAKLMKLPVDQVAQCHRHQRLAGVGLAGQLRHHDQAAALRQRRAQRRAGGDAGRARASPSHAAAFEGNNGFYRSFGRALPTDFAPFDDLGSAGISIEPSAYSIKNYPCGGRGHTAIEAALIAARQDRRAARTRSPTSIAWCRRRARRASTPTIRPTSRRRNSPPPM